MPIPPKSHRLPDASFQLAHCSRHSGNICGRGGSQRAVNPGSPFGKLADIEALLMALPLIHVHSPFAPDVGSNFHKSLSCPTVPVESYPLPPKTQTLPDASFQVVASSRPPGRFVETAVPRCAVNSGQAAAQADGAVASYPGPIADADDTRGGHIGGGSAAATDHGAVLTCGLGEHGDAVRSTAGRPEWQR